MSEPTPPTPSRWPLTVVGWYGSLAVVGAYFGHSMGYLEPGALYQGLNLTGGLGLAAVCVVRRAWQPLFVNVTWVVVAFAALLRLA